MSTPAKKPSDMPLGIIFPESEWAVFSSNFRRPPALHHSQARDSRVEFFFRLQWLGNACTVTTVDKMGNRVMPAAGCYSGPVRAALFEVERAREKDAWQVDWHHAGDESDILLAGNLALLRALFTAPNVLNPEGQLVRTELSIGKLVLVLRNAAEDMIASSLEWHDSHGERVVLSKPRMVSEDSVLDGDVIRRIDPIGIHFAAVVGFPSLLPKSGINAALSLVTSAFPEMEIVWDGIDIRAAAPVELRPTAVFESVDDDGALILRTGNSLPGFDSDFLRDFDPSRVVRFDEEEQVLRISEVDATNSLAALQNLQQSFAKLSKQLRDPGAYWRLLDDDTHLLGPHLASVFLRDHLGALVANFQLFGAEKLRTYRVAYHRPKLRMQLGHGIDYLEGEATLDFDGESIDLWKALEHYKKDRLIPLSDGTQAVVDPAYIARLHRLLKKSADGVKISFFDLPLVEELLEENADTGMSVTRGFFTGFNDLANRKIPLKNFRGSLRGYQEAGVRWMDYLYAHGVGGCLADDMGLGKTVQAIALLTRVCPDAEAPSLLVMPRSLLFNWARELAQFAPKLRFAIFHQTDRDWEAATKQDLILTTYGTLRSDIERISKTEFNIILLDESQAIKNHETQTARAACLLKGKFRLALSGTPVENNLGELHALFRFLNPGMFPVKAEFDRNYVQPIQQAGDAEAATELRKKIYPFLLRRLKQNVLTELPPKIEQTLFVEMGAEQAALYHERREFFRQWIAGEVETKGFQRSQLVILEALLELRQIATVPESKTDGAVISAKRERILEAIEEVISNGRKCLVFSNFVAGVEQVGGLLQEHGITSLCMTGTTTNRQSLVEKFQRDPHVKALVMTLKTGGVGLNLTAADTVFILDPWWNTAAEAQAVDRTHRIGQQNTVFTYRLIAKDTIEEKILQLQDRKRALVDSVISSDAGALKQLSAEDVQHLFRA